MLQLVLVWGGPMGLELVMVIVGGARVELLAGSAEVIETDVPCDGPVSVLPEEAWASVMHPGNPGARHRAVKAAMAQALMDATGII